MNIYLVSMLYALLCILCIYTMYEIAAVLFYHFVMKLTLKHAAIKGLKEILGNYH